MALEPRFYGYAYSLFGMDPSGSGNYDSLLHVISMSDSKFVNWG